MLRRLGRPVASVGMAVVLWSPVLAAAETKASYELSYEGAPGCPTDAAFRRAALSHVHDTTAVGARIQVRIEKGDDEYRGELTAMDEEGNVGRRSIQGPTCKTVAQALAFLAGLAIELGGRLKSLEPEPEPEPPAAAPVPAPKPPAPKPPPPPPAPRAPGPAVSVAVLGEARFGFAPSPSPSLQVAVDVESRAARVLAPALRAGIAGAWAELADDVGSATLRYLAVRAEGCPFRISSGADASLELRPCLGFELGHVWAESHAATSPKDGSQLWPSGEALARLKWRISGSVFVEADAVLGVPFVRPRYYFQPDHLLHEVPPVTGRAAIGCGYSF